MIALPDFLDVIKIGIETDRGSGILNVADDCPMFLQDIFDLLADHWGYRRPKRIADGWFTAAARIFDLVSRLTGIPVPLNPDILAMGKMPSVADTTKLKTEFGYQVKYRALADGLGKF